MSTSMSEAAVDEASSSSFGPELGTLVGRTGSDLAWKGRCLALCLMAWGGVRLRTKAGIPFGPVGAIFGEVILCWEEDSDGRRVLSFL